VHLSIFISVFNQLDAQTFCFRISLFHASTCFEHHVLIIRRSKLHYIASGIITPIGGRLVHRCTRLIPKQIFCASSCLITEINKHKFLFYNKFSKCLYLFRTLCAHHQEVKIALHRLWYHHTYHQEVKIAIRILWYHHIYHQEVKTALHSLWYHHTYRCDDTRGCVMQF